MNHVTLIIRKELLNFVGSDRGLFAVYSVLIISWGLLLATWQDTTVIILPLWLALFSVIIAAGFSNTVFVAERVTGSLEILLTSGISRTGILYGKIGFVFFATVAVGLCCFVLAAGIKLFLPEEQESAQPVFEFSGCLLYFGGAFLATASSAWLSVILPNPRILHLLNVLIVGFAVSIRFVLESLQVPFSMAIVTVLMGLMGAGFLLLARREFNGERIIKPVIL